ncbi:MAG: archease [Rhodospirillales bacterium]|nr:archease [Rhodospirillales bacterium]
MNGQESSCHAVDRAGWEHFPHDADIGVRGWGSTVAQAFEETAIALTHVVTDADIRPLRQIIVSCQAPDAELLLVDWLNAIIYEMAVERMLFSRFAVVIDDDLRLRGFLWGEPVDIPRHAPAVEPKGATCTALRVVRERDGRWTAACVVDV